MSKVHTLHIPVMGTGFSIDTPIKVAKYGINSVISLVDDTLIEEMRKFYSSKIGETYIPITKDDEDYRANRITAYLNLVDRIVKKQFEELKNSAFEIGSEITKYFKLLPEASALKRLYYKMLKTQDQQLKLQLQQKLRDSIEIGDINVNIMTKLDRPNYSQNGIPLPVEFSDALSALRGYAESTLQSAIVFSAGINQRLYSYVEEFKDFYADAKGFIKKRIIIKVSDFRSSFIQGKFFAKKGLWISEYRIESGLNCGGHVFPTAGLLMGPILEEFKSKKEELISTLHKIYNSALELKNKIPFANPHEVRITTQGGIGTAKEDQFLRSYYKIDGTGWATPFLLCPEATNVDSETLKKLQAATENDLYVSDVSPLGIPFNNLRGNNSDLEKQRRIQDGRPGSPCPRGHLVSNTEFSDKPICRASRQYQRLKIAQLDKMNLSKEEYQRQFNEITDKACICYDLGQGALIKNNISLKAGQFTSVCPGPNLAYFSKIVSLKEMVDHIYGRINILNSTYRPHMFINELKINIDFLLKEVKQSLSQLTQRKIEYFNEYKSNLFKGIDYYQELFPIMEIGSESSRYRALAELRELKDKFFNLIEAYPQIFSKEGELVSV